MERLLAGVVVILTLAPHLHARGVSESNDEWDVLIFTQQWPITSCTSHQQHHGHPSCTLYPNMTSWTVHGIWPTKLGTIGPNFCNRTWTFNETAILPFEGLMIKYWGNIFAGSSTTSLWNHEWLKHGTCAAEIPQLDSEKKYFSKGLEWVLQYDMVSLLTRHSIYPGDLTSYTLDQIFSAIHDAYGVNSAIDCYYNKETKQNELWQVKLCFDRTLKLVDCDGIIGSGGYNKILNQNPDDKEEREAMGNCPTSGIVYPSSVRVGDRTFSYPRELAVQHTRNHEGSLSSCVGKSWVCDAFVTVLALMWITL